jgi:transcriptional regulator with XRE-family HTH domain
MIGNKIAQLRKFKNLTQKELAEMLNVSDKVVSKWETEKSLPDVETMLKLSKVLDISISELYDLVGNTNTKKMEEYNEEKIWQYKKYSIISCSLVFLSPILFLFLLLFISDYNLPYQTQAIIVIILLVLFLALFLIGQIIQITQFVRLYSYSKDKYYKAEYIRVLKKYGIIFLLCLLLPILIFFSIVIILNLLY